MREKMDRSLRAKQFLPFSAVKGLDEALERKRIEKEKDEKKVILSDVEDEINRELNFLEDGDLVFIEYYDDGEYKEGLFHFKKINQEEGTLSLLEGSLFLSDISKIEKKS